MPQKLNIGLAKKVGLPDYGSLCASCHVEHELDEALEISDTAGFHELVREAFVACSQAVHAELARQQQANGADAAPASRPLAATARRVPAGRRASNGQNHRATAKQVDCLQKLAGDIRGLDARRLESLATKMFARPLADLSSLDASALIDTLKEVKAGKLDLAAALRGGAV